MQARTHLIRIQRTLYDRLKEYAREFLGSLSPELKKYFQEYQRDFHDFKKVSNKSELLAGIQKAHISICGDYHTLSQAQRTVIRLLRDSLPELKRQNRKTILALEMLRPVDNKVTEAYLNGEVSEVQFHKKIGFRTRWGFDWANYKGLFQFAAENDIEVVGINPSSRGKTQSLRERDKVAAEILAALSEQNPDALIFVLIGDLHLAHNHLPRDLEIALSKKKIKRKTLVIHQNSERFYWKLVDRGMEQFVDVIKVKDNVYCVMNTPPWVKLQSHLKWQELVNETGEAPTPDLNHDPVSAPTMDEAIDELDRSEDLSDFLNALREFLGIPPSDEDDFSIHGPGDFSFWKHVKESHVFSRPQLKMIERYLGEFKGYFIPKLNVFYLQTLSVNQSTSQVAVYLHSLLSGFQSIFYHPKEDFYRFVWVEALGFFGSKALNHKRKCNGKKDLERMVEQAKTNPDLKPNARIAQFVLHHIAEESRLASGKRFSLSIPEGVGENRVVFYYKSAKLLGHLLGQALYSAVMAGKVSRKELKDLYHLPFQKMKPNAVRLLYFTWIARLDRFGYRKIANRERL